jgi:cyclophilin family peptidyl-prolyl cis-trans isomerase
VHHRSSSAPRSSVFTAPGQLESLESRLLLTARVTSVFADNRGWVSAVVSENLDPNTVTASSVRLFIAGADGKLGTPDDALINAPVSYDASTRTITARGVVAANTGYRLVLTDFIKNLAGRALDGEFIHPDGPSGNGAAGGAFDAVIRSAAGQKVVRFTTDAGVIDARMFTNTPLNVANFLKYADFGRYDNTFFHRILSGFVAQGGGFRATGPLSYAEVQPFAPVQNEPVNSNVKDTIAFAKLPPTAPGGGPNSATNEFFFNLADNSGNLDNQNGGFTAFGEVIPGASRVNMDKLGQYPTRDADGPNSELFDNLPTQPGTTQLNLQQNAVDLQRVAVHMDVAPTTPWRLGAAADFNADGNTDIVWRNYNTGSNVLWIMNNGTRTNSILLPELANTAWELVGAFDVDGDSDQDLFWRNRATGQNTMWLLQNNKISSFKALPPVVSQSWRLEGVGDLNNDGDADLVWRNYDNGRNSVWFMTGTAAPANQMKALPPVFNVDYDVQAVGDFNNDSRDDIVFRNARTGQNQLWFFSGNTRTGVKVLPTRLDTAFAITTAGQFDNRPGSDLFWSNYTTRVNDGWSLNNTGAYQANIAFPAVPA